MIDARFLIAATGCRPDVAYRYADWLAMAAERWGIDKPVRVAAWIAQCAHESGWFRIVEENLNYTTPARLIAVWPSRFRLPVTDREARLKRHKYDAGWRGQVARWVAAHLLDAFEPDGTHI